MTAKALTLALAVRSVFAGSALRLAGSESQIVFGDGAVLSAACSASARVKWISPQEIQELLPSHQYLGVHPNITVYLLGVPPTCANAEIDTPCAGGSVPPLFFCNYAGQRGDTVALGPYLAHRASDVFEGRAMGVQVHLVCPLPAYTDVQKITNDEAPELRLELTYLAPAGAATAKAIPFAGLADGNVIKILAMAPPPLSPPAPPPPPPPCSEELLTYDSVTAMQGSTDVSTHNGARNVNQLQRPLDANFDYASNDWLTPATSQPKDGKDPIFLTFTFGEAVDVSEVYVWNQNEYTNGHREPRDIALDYLVGDGDEWVNVGSYTLFNSLQARPNPRQTLVVGTESPPAKKWRMRIMNVYETGWDGYVGLMGVRFLSCAA